MRNALVVAIALTACTATDPLEDRWDLVWSDTFDGPDGSPIDEANWTFDVGGDGWGNNQLEYDTDRTDNASLNGKGQLRIVARRESFQSNEWTSARIKTKEKVELTYGKIEAGILLPEGKGFWPAFWMLGANIDDVGWPNCGEIDILEMRGDNPYEVIGTVHGPGYSGVDSVGDSLDSDEKYTAAYHVYRVEWDPEHIAWFVDDELMHTVHPGDVRGPWVFDHDFFILLNLAVGGSFLEDPDASTPAEGVMEVDFVRVFERALPLTDPSE